MGSGKGKSRRAASTAVAPAVKIESSPVERDGVMEWRVGGKPDGLLHREDGPARVCMGMFGGDGSKEWYINGKQHRVDGPAGEYAVGVNYWMQNGEFHREDGPAIERGVGGLDNVWIVHGRKTTEDAALELLMADN